MHTTKIYLQTGYLLDSSFERVLTNQRTIAKLLPDMQTTWDEYGPKLLDATVNAIGKSFRRKELLCYLIMHPTMFSCSHPFLININKFLEFHRSDAEQAVRLAEVIYHEALHILLDDNFPTLLDEDSPSASPLIQTYKKLGPHVTAHMHLYAIQKHVLEKLGMDSTWDMVCEGAKSAHNSGYKIAVDLVNEIGSQPFLDELKANHE